MAYARWGTSDWYVYPSDNGIECNLSGGGNRACLIWTPDQEYSDFKAQARAAFPPEKAEGLFQILESNMYDIMADFRNLENESVDEEMRRIIKSHGYITVELSDDGAYVVGFRYGKDDRWQFRSGPTLHEAIANTERAGACAEFKRTAEQRLMDLGWTPSKTDSHHFTKTVSGPFTDTVSCQIAVLSTMLMFKCYDTDGRIVFDAVCSGVDDAKRQFYARAEDKDSQLYHALHGYSDEDKKEALS